MTARECSVSLTVLWRGAVGDETEEGYKNSVMKDLLGKAKEFVFYSQMKNF